MYHKNIQKTRRQAGGFVVSNRADATDVDQQVYGTNAASKHLQLYPSSICDMVSIVVMCLIYNDLGSPIVSLPNRVIKCIHPASF